MTRIFPTIIFIFFGMTAFAQLPNQQGQVWKEYDLRQVAMPPPNIQTFNKDAGRVELPMQAPSIIDIVKRETGKSAWSGQGFGLIETDGQKLFVYNTPAIQQKVAETIGRFQRPETKNVRFVMDTCFYACSDVFYERMGTSFAIGLRSDLTFKDDGSVSKLEQQHPELPNMEYISPMFKYMRPILHSEGLPICKQPGMNAYWVAREDIPKFLEAQSFYKASVLGDRRSSVLECPQVAAHNGQLGAVLDTTSRMLATHSLYIAEKNDFQAFVENFHQGQTYSSFSLLSWDGKMVSSDFHVEFSAIAGGPHEQALETTYATRYGIPKINRITFSEKGLIFPAGGMLVVHVQGKSRLSEEPIELGSPILNKIPYAQRLFSRTFSSTAFSRENQAVHGMITIRMLVPNEVPQAAVKTVDGNRVVR